MSRCPLDYLRHIRDEALFLRESAKALTKEDFLQDEIAKRAFVRSIEIIGDATKNVPRELKQRHPQVEWRAIAGMRDRVIHGYFDVNYNIVWDVATNKVPILLQQIEAILEQEAPARPRKKRKKT